MVPKEIIDLANYCGQSLRSALRLDIAPEDAMVRQARAGHRNLIAVGMGRSVGGTSFFGKVAATILEKSILFVSS